MRKVALVTGASSGIGRLAAAKLAAKGYDVFGTSRDAYASAPEGVRMLQLDVQSDHSVATCIENVLLLAGRIDLLINNAGHLHAGVIEETSLPMAKEVFETNLWGTVRVTNAVLPTMRKQRAGHIINVGSLAGLVGMAGMGFYCASKFALEGYTETLGMEVLHFNIIVSLVEPGFFRTNLHQASENGGRKFSDYKILRGMAERYYRKAIEQGDDPEKVADLIVKLAGKNGTRLRYRIGGDAVWLPRLKMLLPQQIFRGGMRRHLIAMAPEPGTED